MAQKKNFEINSKDSLVRDVELVINKEISNETFTIRKPQCNI